MRLFSPAGFSNKLLVWLCKLMTCSTGGVTSLLCAILAGRNSQWRAYDVGSQLPDIRCYPSVQKGKADFALIAKGPLGLRGPKITLVIWSKSVDKHLTFCTHRGSNWGSLEEAHNRRYPHLVYVEFPTTTFWAVNRSRRIACEFSVCKGLFRVRQFSWSAVEIRIWREPAV